MSRYGRISWSLMNFQMIRVISSPSISTTGFLTLIFAILRSHLSKPGIANGRRADGKSGALTEHAAPPAEAGSIAWNDDPLDEFVIERATVSETPPDSASERGERGVQRGARTHRGRRLGVI